MISLLNSLFSALTPPPHRSPKNNPHNTENSRPCFSGGKQTLPPSNRTALVIHGEAPHKHSVIRRELEGLVGGARCFVKAISNVSRLAMLSAA